MPTPTHSTPDTPDTPCISPSERRSEWLKPVMFTAGVGLLEDAHVHKLPPEPGMIVCKVGGPAYRIGEWCGHVNKIPVTIPILCA